MVDLYAMTGKEANASAKSRKVHLRTSFSHKPVISAVDPGWVVYLHAEPYYWEESFLFAFYEVDSPTRITHGRHGRLLRRFSNRWTNFQ